MNDLPLHIDSRPCSDVDLVSRAALLAGGTDRAVWRATRPESHDFLPAFDRRACSGLERESITAVLRDHTYTSDPLQFRTLRNCYVMPQWGIVFDAEGAVNHEASRVAAWLSPELSMLPGVVRRGDLTCVTADALAHATDVPGPHLLLHHAGLNTYGHWMADCILGAWVFAEEIRRGELRLLAWRLERWHRQTLDAFDMAHAVTESLTPLVRCEQLVIPSSLDISNVTRPTNLLGECFRALRRGCPPPQVHIPRLPRLYIARGPERRTMRNEGALIAALEERGFVAVYPRGMSVAQQAHLFSGAECIVGPSGSAMVNVVYMEAGSHVVEVCSVSKSNFWIARLSALLGFRYATTVVDVAPEDRDSSVLYGVPRGGLDYRYDADIPAVLRALDVLGFH